MKEKNGNRLTGAYMRACDRRVHLWLHPMRSTKTGERFEKTPAVSREAAGVCGKKRKASGGATRIGRAASALDVQPIVGKTHALGELAVGLALAAGLVTHVDEIGVLGVHPARHLHRLLDGLVRVVRLVA